MLKIVHVQEVQEVGLPAGCWCPKWTCCVGWWVWSPGRSSSPLWALCSSAARSPASWTPGWDLHLGHQATPRVPWRARVLLCLGTDHLERGPTVQQGRSRGQQRRLCEVKSKAASSSLISNMCICPPLDSIRNNPQTLGAVCRRSLSLH